MSKDLRTPKNKCLRFGEFLRNLESDDGVCDAGAFQGKRIQLICMASRIGWPAVLLQSYAFPVLTSMFSSTLKSAVTFTMTSEHALCFSLGSGSSFLPLGLADHALPRKKRLKSLVKLLPKCRFSDRVCLKLREPRLRAACCLQWWPTLGTVGGRRDNNCSPRQWGRFYQRGHLFKINPSSPHSGGFTSSLSSF